MLSLTLALILTSGTLISYMADEPWVESLWAAALGSGLDWGFINSKSASLRFIAVCTNVGGLVVTALLLSLISDAVQTKYDSLRKGSSPVTVRETFFPSLRCCSGYIAVLLTCSRILLIFARNSGIWTYSHHRMEFENIVSNGATSQS